MSLSTNAIDHVPIDYVWCDVIDVLSECKVESRNGLTHEILGAQMYIDPSFTFLLNPTRGASPIYAAAEIFWYMSRTSDARMIMSYAPSYVKYLDNGRDANGAYGARIAQQGLGTHDQMQLVIQHLSNDRNSRRAVMQIWRSNDLMSAWLNASLDLPCTLSLQFFIRNNKGLVITTMRSNDIWLGFPYDVFAFTCIGRYIFGKLGVPLAGYVHQVGSLHAYDRNYNKAIMATTFDYKALNMQSHPWELDDGSALLKAIQLEEDMRLFSPYVAHIKKRVINFLYVIAQTNTMTHDLLCCVAEKWYPGEFRDYIKSPQLKRGFENAHS